MVLAGRWWCNKMSFDSGEVVTEKQIWLNVKARWVVRPVCGQCGLWENLVKNNQRAVGASATGVAGQNVCRRDADWRAWGRLVMTIARCSSP